LEGLGRKINQNYISNFSEVWVPDLENEAESLSGELSHGKHFHPNVKYIGPQSRLKTIETTFENNRYDLLILLSGPEPSRTQLENELHKAFNDPAKRIAMVRGTTSQSALTKGMEIHDLPVKEKLKELILSSKKIICRSGYSTLMDMHALGKKELILMPTPGQTEQEYLASYWQKKFNAEIRK
jgi:hypothetical protein